MWRHVDLVRTDVSEECIDPINRMKRISKLGMKLAVTNSLILFPLMMGAILSCLTVVLGSQNTATNSQLHSNRKIEDLVYMYSISNLMASYTRRTQSSTAECRFCFVWDRCGVSEKSWRKNRLFNTYYIPGSAATGCDRVQILNWYHITDLIRIHEYPIFCFNLNGTEFGM
jgi:hypothetical protein